MALLYSPAFLAGHIIAKFTSYPADGFSVPYQLSLLIESFLILFIGLFYLRKVALIFLMIKLLLLLLYYSVLAPIIFKFRLLISPHRIFICLQFIVYCCTLLSYGTVIPM